VRIGRRLSVGIGLPRWQSCLGVGHADLAERTDARRGRRSAVRCD
jgi:hypothetical protein